MEAEIIALAACCKELFPIMDMVSSVTNSVKLPIGKTTMSVSIHDENSGALVLAKLCLHSPHPEASTTQSRRFGFFKKSSKEVFNYTRLTRLNS